MRKLEEKNVQLLPIPCIKNAAQVHRMWEHSFILPSGKVNGFHLKQIAPTTGMKEPPPTEELLKGPWHLRGWTAARKGSQDKMLVAFIWAQMPKRSELH